MIQNDADVGHLNDVTLGDEGFVIVIFTNGATDKIYELPLATFQLTRAPARSSSRPRPRASSTCAARMRAAAAEPRLAFEAANVDLADEFTKMIVTQGAYSANARIVTTADEMLDALIRIIR